MSGRPDPKGMGNKVRKGQGWKKKSANGDKTGEFFDQTRNLVQHEDGSNQTTFPLNYAGMPTKQQQRSALKAAAIGGNLFGASPWGIVHADEQDWDELLNREAVKKAIDYDKIFLRMFDGSDPAHQAIMRELRPDYFTERMKFLKQIAAIQVQMAQITLMGIQTKEDLDLVIALQMLPPSVPRAPDGSGLPAIITKPVHMLNRDDDTYEQLSGRAGQEGNDNISATRASYPRLTNVTNIGSRIPGTRDGNDYAPFGLSNQRWGAARSPLTYTTTTSGLGASAGVGFYKNFVNLMGGRLNDNRAGLANAYPN